MGKMKNKVMDFLDEGGRDLGFDENQLPKLEHMSNIIAQRIPIWEYYHSSKKDYYHSKNINMFEGGKDE